MNDDELDARLHAWASAARESAPLINGPDALTAGASVSRGRRLMPALAAAAVVLAVVGVVTAMQLSSDGNHRSPAQSATGPATGTTPLPVPAGQKRVVFHGLAIDVPAGWPLNATQCGAPIEDTVILPGLVPACLWARPPAVTFVQFYGGTGAGPTSALRDVQSEAVTITGRPATRLSGVDGSGSHVVAVTLPSLSAQVVITAPDAATAAALAGSLIVVGTDPNGCASSDDGLGTLPTGRAPVRQGAAQDLIPGSPHDVTICRYVGGLIEQSATLDGSGRVALVSLMNGLPAGVSRANPQTYAPTLCRRPDTSPGSTDGGTAIDSEAYLIHAHYDTGPSVAVVVRLGFCGDLGASNGSRTGRRTQALAAQLTKLVGESVGIPGDTSPSH